MVIKLSKYFLAVFFISLFLILSFYIYNVYFLNRPIFLNKFNQTINKNVENYFSNKISSNLYNIDIEKSFIEINKLPSLLSINFIDVKITDKKQFLQSKLNTLKVTFTAKDIFKNFYNKSEFSANTIKIDTVDFNATLYKDQLKLGPLMYFLVNQFKKKSEIKVFNLDQSKIIFNKFNINIDDKANFFEKNKLNLKCKSISSLSLSNSNNNLNLNCKENNYLDFNLNLLKTPINKIDINGTINKFNPKILNQKQFNFVKPIIGNLIGNYNINLTEQLLLKNIKLKIKDKSKIVFDNPILDTNEVFLNGEIKWTKHDNTVDLKNIRINHAMLGGKISFKDKNVFSNISLEISQLSLKEIKNFFHNRKKLELFSKYKNHFEKFSFLKDQGNIKNIILNLSTAYNLKDNLFSIKQIDSIGKVKNISFKKYPDEITNLRNNFDGDFNFSSQKNNFQLKIDGFFKNSSFNYKQQRVSFEKIKVSTLINNSSIILEEILFYKKDVKTIFVKGKLWNKKNKLKIGKLNITLDKMSPNLILNFINKFSKLESFRNVKLKKGKLIKSKIYLKLTDDNGKKLKKNIVIAELNFKDLSLNIKNLNSDLKIKTLIANFDQNTKLFGYVEGFFDKHQFNFNYQIDKNKKIKALGNLLSSKTLENLVFNKTGFEIKSMPNLRIQLDGNLFDGFFKMHAYSDLKNSIIRNNFLNISKPKNLNSKISVNFEFKNYKLKNLHNLNFSYGLRNISCDVNFLLNNKLQIKNLKSYNFDLKKINISKLNEEVLISASGNKINLTHFKKNLLNKSLKNEKKIKFDLTSNQIKLDKKLSISGNYRGSIVNNKISSVAVGKMLLDKKEILDAGEIKVNVKNKNYTLIGQGLLGGAKTRVQIIGSEKQLPNVVFESDDGGKLLSALDFTNNIKSGKMILKIKYLDKELSKYNGLIEGKNFSIVNAPGIVKSLSSLSFSGINSLFVGQGVKFEDGVAVFLKTPEKMIFKKILINNETLSIFLNGKYNLNSKNIEFTGSIAPINIISKIISVVPAVGQLLTGINKKGIIAGQFKLTGDIKNPEVNLNEMSFAPGILREIFSRNWVKENSLKLNNQ